MKEMLYINHPGDWDSPVSDSWIKDWSSALKEGVSQETPTKIIGIENLDSKLKPEMNAEKPPTNSVGFKLILKSYSWLFCFDLKIVQIFIQLHDLTPIEPYIILLLDWDN